jgi:hypothetical protein
VGIQWDDDRMGALQEVLSSPGRPQCRVTEDGLLLIEPVTDGTARYATRYWT